MKACLRCGVQHEATTEFFYKHHTNVDRLANFCKECVKAQQKAYLAGVGEHGAKLRSYLKTDRKKGFDNDLTFTFVGNVLGKPCFYCGTTDSPRGLDRLDNSLGHLQANVVPCCYICNVARNDNFTPDEFKLIGAVIAQIRTQRNEQKTSPG